MTDLAEQIREQLAMAAAHDPAAELSRDGQTVLALVGELVAREQRREAGRLLALAREQETGSGWYLAAGIGDESSARLLIQLAAGGVPYEFER